MKWIIPLVCMLLAVLLGVAIYTETRPDPERLSFKVAGDVAYGFGTSKDGSADDFRKFTREHPNVKTIVLKAMPGTHHSVDNLKLARHLRKKGINTHLQADSWIASGAVDIFLSGKTRTMECGARIGVHSWSTQFGQSGQDEGKDYFERLHKRFLADMGIPPKFYEFTRAAAAPEDIHWLTVDEINRFGLLSAPLDCPS